MYKICIFAGTTEARRRVELLSSQRYVAVTACVATEYGETLLPDADNVTVRSGRIPVDGIIQLLSDMKFDLVIDATHPYAASITESVARACAETGTEYLRLLREASEQAEDALCVADAEEAAALLSKTEGNILLTTGSKDLKIYRKIKGFRERVYARVLPLDASLALCREAGVETSHILAMQGPFSEEMDEAMLRAVSAQWLVTKDGGEAGGFAAKAAAARKAGAQLLGVGRPKQRDGKTFSQVLDLLAARFGCAFRPGDDDARSLPRDRGGGLPDRCAAHAGRRRAGGAENLCRRCAAGDRRPYPCAPRIQTKRSRDVGRYGFFQRHEKAAAAAFRL